MAEELGYSTVSHYHRLTRRLVERYRSGSTGQEGADGELELEALEARPERVFPHVDGVKFLRHELGCGGTYGDAISLCGLLAGYINHPNVAGATVLSLGCQKSQIKDLQHELQLRNPDFDKPLLIFEQQQMPSEKAMLSVAIRETLAGLAVANEARRQPAPLSQLTLGVECGASDGFSGLSANPAIGHCSDLLVALGGSVILSEFPELAGCEQNLADRCVSTDIAQRFLKIMHDYDQQAMLVGGSFATNPSPGNIRDGLITDAMKSAGAAKKGGTSPVVDVLDYPEPIRQRGLNLLCTPVPTWNPPPPWPDRERQFNFFPPAWERPREIPSRPSSKSQPIRTSPNKCRILLTLTRAQSSAEKRHWKKLAKRCWKR